MKLNNLNISRTVINLFLILVAAGFLWYIAQSQNLLQEKPKSSVPNQNIVEIPFKEKSYLLDYKKFDPQMVENIGLFTREEKWIGSGFYDMNNYFEFPSSLYVAGGERNKITNVRDISLNLAKILSFDLVMNFRSEAADLETADLAFSDIGGKSAVYILPKLDKGWQVITVPVEQFSAEANFDWARIAKVKFDFVPRIAANILVNLGSLRGQPGSIIYNDWNVINQSMLALDKRNNTISLLVRNIGATVATMKKITWAQNFTFQSSYMPLNSGSSGLFFRGNYQTGQGYYLIMNGLNSNKWQLYKNGKEGTKVLVMGEINNFQFKPQEKYYLRVEVKENNIKAFFSTDNENYTVLANLADSEFLSGGVGVATTNGAVTLFNDFEFSQ